MRSRMAIVVVSIIIAAFFLTACPNPLQKDNPVNLLAIPGVTAPVLGATPVTTITETAQYTGILAWSSAVTGSFAADTVYTATITLTVKTGYTLTGVGANSFTVAGATSVSNPANSGVVTAVFPATTGDINFTLTPGTYTNGTMTPSTAMTLIAGTPQALVAMPAPGYSFAGWTASPTGNASFGSQSSANTTVTLSGNATITPSFVVLANVAAYAYDKAVWLHLPTVSGATKYKIYWAVGSTVTTDSTTSWEVTGTPLPQFTYAMNLTNGTSYAYLVVPYTDATAGQSFPVVTCTPTTTQPVIQTITPADGSVAITWSQVATTSAYYVIYRVGHEAGPGAQATPVLGPFTGTSATIAGLTNSTHASARVVAVMPSGNVMSELINTSADAPLGSTNYLADSAFPIAGAYTGTTIATQCPQWTWGGEAFLLYDHKQGINAQGFVMAGNNWGSFSKIVDVSSFGLTKLEAPTCKLTFSIWYAPRYDNMGKAAFKMELLSSTDAVLDTVEPYSQTAPLVISDHLALNWKKQTLTYTNATAKSIAKVRITVAGNDDPRNWAGNYGPSFTYPSLSIEEGPSDPVTLLAIPNVTAPALGATPATTLDSAQYSGVIAWSPAVTGTFARGITYTATITLTPKAGYTLSGVAANSFTVAGATSAANTVNNGVVTAVFPATVMGLPMSMKDVPAGRYIRRDADGWGNISVVSAFRIGQYEVTRGQFQTVMGTDPSVTSRSSGSLDDPVQNVNYYHMIAFCSKLSLRDGLTPVYSVTANGSTINWSTLAFADIPTTMLVDGWSDPTTDFNANGYRLPTRDEWIWAAMGAPANADTDVNLWNKAFAGSTGTNILNDYAWTSGNSVDATHPDGASHPVGTKLPNELDLYDMSGNVFEYAGNWLCQANGLYEDYRGPDTRLFGSEYRTGYGGSTWRGLTAEYYRVSNSNHGGNIVGQRDPGIGFRVATKAPATTYKNHVSLLALTDVARPVTGATPVRTLDTAQYTGTVAWSPAVAVGGTFAAGTAYSASITLTAKAGWTLNGVAENGFTVPAATIVGYVHLSGVVGAIFPATASFTMVSVPAGSFQRDATATNISVISTAFKMSVHEITRAQYSAMLGAEPSTTANSSGTTDPVQTANWYHAITYCNKLSLAEGLTPVYSVTGVTFSSLAYASIPTSDNTSWNGVTANWSANGYRLPTEMEWMWAAMGGDTGNPGNRNTTGYLKTFAGSTGSNSIGSFAVYGYADNPKTAGQTTTERTSPVGSKTANELGLYDLSGNVYEWVWDGYGSYPTGTLTDYRGAASAANRVERGGGWRLGASFCTVAERGNLPPSPGYWDSGFRVVRVSN